MKGKEALSRLGAAAERVVFGPRTEGTVELVVRDPQERKYWHVLVETTEGEKKHFTFPDHDVVYVVQKGWETEQMPYKRGQQIDIRVRGTGFVPMPWSKVERDPFGLKEEKRKSP